MKLAILILLVLLLVAPAVTLRALDSGAERAQGAAQSVVEAVNCERRARPVVVNLRNWQHRHILDHAWDAIRAGHPRLLHVDRAETDSNREASLRGIPTKPGYDRDEYPPAMSDEGGRGASVRYVRLSENRSAGSVMGHQLSRYCNGQPFRYERRPR